MEDLDGKMTELNGGVSIVRLYIDRIKLEIVRSVVTQLSVLRMARTCAFLQLTYHFDLCLGLSGNI